MAMQPKRQSGFTLIELVVVIFIIALVSGILLLRLPSVQHARIQAQVAEIISTLRLARAYAISHNQWVMMSVAPTQLQFFHLVTSDPDASQFIPLGDDHRFWQISAQSGYDFAIKFPTTIDAWDQKIYFWPTGEVTPFILTLARDSDRYFIQVDDQGIHPVSAEDIK